MTAAEWMAATLLAISVGFATYTIVTEWQEERRLEEYERHLYSRWGDR